MKKIFEIPQLKVVRFETADIILTSDCGQWWYCGSYNDYAGHNGEDGGIGTIPVPNGCNSGYQSYSSGYGECSNFGCDSFGI